MVVAYLSFTCSAISGSDMRSTSVRIWYKVVNDRSLFEEKDGNLKLREICADGGVVRYTLDLCKEALQRSAINPGAEAGHMQSRLHGVCHKQSAPSKKQGASCEV